MAAKRKRRKSANKTNRTIHDPEIVEARAQQALDAGHYRAAIADFKAMLKTAERPKWQQGLAEAYLGRARELTAKGMLKEALAIGEVRRKFCPEAAPDPEHLMLLLRTGKSTEAVRLYRQGQQSLDPRTLAELRARLAAVYLSGQFELVDELPKDDPIIADGVPARAALDAWCRGDDEATAQLLAGIPFRSPYRDWVQVIKALMKSPIDAEAAQALLQRVPADSPFSPLARAAELARLPESAFADALAQAPEVTQHFAATLRGWPEGRLKLWRKLQAEDGAREAKRLARIMYQQRKVLGKEWVHQRGLRLLVDGFPRSLHHSPLFHDRTLTLFEQNLVAAWQAEEEGDPWDVLDAWRDVIEQLQVPSDPSPGSNDALRIALIQRRLDSRWGLLGRPFDPYADEQLSPAALFELEQSLRYDPDDPPTYIRLISYHRTGKRLQEARHLLDRALARWPDDVDLLNEALETAVASGAFKKAAGFARRILKQDPINTRARNSLLEARLAHAAKQLKKGRTDLAERELNAATEWAQGEKAEARLGLLRGFVTLEDDWSAGAAQLRALVERLGGGIRGQLVLALEVERLDRPVGSFMKKLGLPRIKQPRHDDLLSFLRDLREQLDSRHEIPRVIPAFFEPALKRAARLELTQQERESTCETLRRCGLQQARLAHARAALKRWPGLPVFELHAFEAKRADQFWNANVAEFERLENALERARSDGDARTAHRIEELLGQITYRRPFTPPITEEFDERLSPDLGEMIEEIGIDGVLEFMRGMGAMDPEFGEVLEAMLNGIPPEEFPIDTDFDPSPPRRPRKRRKPRGKKTGRPADPNDQGGGDETDEDPDPDQLDLFE